jgi:hypothetical protein
MSSSSRSDQPAAWAAFAWRTHAPSPARQIEDDLRLFEGDVILSTALKTMTKTNQGQPFYSAGIAYRGTFKVADTPGRFIVPALALSHVKCFATKTA